MRKFITMLAITLMVSITMSAFTSCSSDDSDDVGYTAQDIVGVWEVASIEGVADFDLDDDFEFELTKHKFSVTFDKGITDGQTDFYSECFRQFYQRHIFTIGEFDILYPICEDGKVVSWEFDDHGYRNLWELKGNKLTTTTYYEGTLDVSSVQTIEKLNEYEMVLYYSAKDIIGGYDDDDPEKPNDYVWYRVTYKRASV